MRLLEERHYPVRLHLAPKKTSNFNLLLTMECWTLWPRGLEAQGVGSLVEGDGNGRAGHSLWDGETWLVPDDSAGYCQFIVGSLSNII